MTPRILLAMCLALWVASQARAADRAAELERLLADYEAALAEFNAQDFPPNAPPAQAIDRYKSYPRWTFLPKILALAEANPTDAAALAASKWIVEQANRLGPQWAPLFDAEKTAWRIIKEQQLSEEEISKFCMLASDRQSPAREAFLRDTARRTDLSALEQAFVTTALASYLDQRFEDIESGGLEAWWPKRSIYDAYLRTQIHDEWAQYETADDPQPFRSESVELFRRVLEEYADVPTSIAASHFSREVTTLGQNAVRSLYALENLVVGAQAPDAVGSDLDGNPLRLSDYRGKVVVLSFWFTGCGPCIAAVPEEQQLVEKFRNEPFAFLGVCRDDDVAVSKKTAEEHGMTWPSWFDAQPGEIVKKYNVGGFPTFYLLDAEGRIVSKDVPRGELASAVEAVLRRSSGDISP